MIYRVAGKLERTIKKYLLPNIAILFIVWVSTTPESEKTNNKLFDIKTGQTPYSCMR